MATATASRTRTGVLLVNLGSPDAPTPAAVRRFLGEFLGDPMVVDTNPVIWWLVRNLIILPLRGRTSAQLYQKVWTDEGSPLIVNSHRLRAALQERVHPEVVVELGMRYRRPSIEQGLRNLLDAGCDSVVLVPLFPQVSRTTTGTVEKEAQAAWRRLGAEPGALRSIDSYHEHEGYIASVAAGIRAELARGPVDHVLLSFHGLPVRYVENGDPYRDHCVATADAVAAALQLGPDDWSLSYQSRFGREPWLLPDTEQVAIGLAREGRRVLVACPGFTADCLETLEEIQADLCETYAEAGGPELRVVPCLNDSAEWVEGLFRIVVEQL